MASIEDALVTEILTLAHASAALELSAQTGWNQTTEDWKVFLAHGRVTGVFAAGRRLVATAATLPYAKFGYLAMGLVPPGFRQRRRFHHPTKRIPCRPDRAPGGPR